MYYYYDVLLNFQDKEDLFKFYEWEEKDDMDLIKKIPLFRIDTKSFQEFIKYEVIFSTDFVSEIKNKTILKSSTKTLKNAFLVSDSKDALALELDDNGGVISRSRLLLADEINLSDVMFTMKETKLNYQKIKKYKEKKSIRQIEEIKKLITCEIDTLYESNNISKLKYLYYEWFNSLSEDIKKMVIHMKKELKTNFDENQQRIYELIKKSYHKVN